MCEILDYSIEHKDIYCNKYSESSSDEMDLYITDSLQDMLDMDIKTEMATDLGSVTDFSDSLGLSFSEMPPLLDMDADNSAMWLTNSSSFGNNLDLYDSEANAIMVNPNSVMPSTFADNLAKTIKEESSNIMLTSATAHSNGLPAPSPKEEKSHLTFSPSTLKVPTIKQEQPEKKIIKKPIEESQMVIYVRKDAAVKDLLTEFETKSAALAKSKTTLSGIRVKPQAELLKLSNKNCSILNSNQKLQQVGTKTIISGNIHILDPQQSRAIIANSTKSGATILINNALHSTSGRQIIKTAGTAYSQKLLNGKSLTTNGFPKPAYSYSCLIAMALKNSRTGSLPVSEIYNFMCQHFPYFKTAPNGWKNSVRHNLSLNKCFEKIEKPSTNGSQRKACLWAMNPTKVEKMDEEVQKWSRKDPDAIKNAMVYPDNLEALERGEMKYSYTGAVADDVDDDDVDVELDQDDGKDEDDDVMEPEGASESELEELTGGVIVNDELGSDVEVLHTFEDEDLDMSQSVKLDLSFTEDEYLSVCPAKRQKTTFIYQPIATTTHANRRKTPLVNRVL